jgi:chromosome partitioning protein
MSSRIISIVNQKGGVGKTTTTTNLATALAAINIKVLVIDLDPQGNASTGFGIDSEQRVPNIYHALVDEAEIYEVIKRTNIPNLDLIPATVDLSGAELELLEISNREFKLKRIIDQVKGKYSYILIDCPPSLSILTLNALVASNCVLIPLQCEFFALEGLSHLLKTISLVQKKLNPYLEIEGVVLTMYDTRNKLTSHVENDVRQCLGDLVYSTVVPRNVRVSEAPSHGMPAIIYDLKCSGSIAYVNLAKELLKRQQAKLKQLTEE